jgi:carbon storage regulator
MLVLTRKVGQTVVIGDDVQVTVMEVRGDKVRLGIVAPRHVSVHRQEVHEAIHGREYTEAWITVPAQSTDSRLIEEIDRRLDGGASIRFTAEGGFFVE